VRPVKLVLEGLRSYRNKTEIDFTDLSLFALIGDTGAGKSSVIEALCLALYGSTTWSGRNVNELMADSAQQMAVELTFTAEDDTWTVTRGHRRAGGAATHKLTSASGQRADGADAVNKRIQRLLGLTKDQFLRAVVMPQGRFEELLKATPGERTDILKGIFRLQALDAVRAQAGAITARWREPIARLDGERGTLPLDPVEAVATATATHRTAVERADKLEERTTKAEAAQDAAAAAKRVVEQISERAARVEDELAAVSPSAIEHIEAAAADIERLSRDATAKRDHAAAEADAANARALAVLRGFANRDGAVTGRNELQQAAKLLEEHLAAQLSATDALTALDAATPPDSIDPALDLAVETARTSHDAAQAAHSDAQAVLTDASRAYRTWVEQRARVAANRAEHVAASNVAADAIKAEQQAAAAAAAAREELAAANEAREHAGRSHAAAAAAAGCAPGDDCPVCARPLPKTFTAPAADDLDAAMAAVTAAASALEACERVARTAGGALATAIAQREAAAAAEARSSAELDIAAHDLESRLTVPVTDTLTEEAAAAELAKAVDRALGAVTAAARELTSASETANRARTDLAASRSRWETEHLQHTQALHRAQRGIGAIREDLSRLPESWRPDNDADPAALTALADTVDSALLEHTAHTDTACEHEARRAAAATELVELGTREATTVIQPTTALVTAASRARTALAQLGQMLAPDFALPEIPSHDAPLHDIAEAVGALHDAATATAAHVATEQHRLTADAQTQVAELEAILADTEAPTLDALHGLAGGARSDATHAADELERVIVSATRAGSIDEALRIAKPFLAALDALSRLLTDGRFIGHLVREREVALLTEASRVLRSLSRDRFGFGDGFKVVDRHSGQERGPDTLSGGERFQASLALALALVEIATRSGGQLEAVFVDEGFGSLDAGSLEQALTTLGSVAVDGKLVALVSHLRQVAEYVDQVLLVERDDATGSRVRLLDPTERDTLLAEDARSRMTA